MRAVVQRVARARCTPGGEIGPGLACSSALRAGDDDATAERLAGKVARLRIFEDDDGKFDRSLLDTGGAALVVSQFTLLADTAKGNRPSFSGAARPEQAEPLYEAFCAALRALGVGVETGVFGARMAGRARQRRPGHDRPRLTDRRCGFGPGLERFLLPSGHHFERFSRWARRAHFL